MAHGARAAAVDITTKFSNGLDTVEKIVRRFAPPTENDTRAYIGRVARELGVGPNQRLNLLRDPNQLARMLKIMGDHENGPGHVTLELMRQGVAMR